MEYSVRRKRIYRLISGLLLGASLGFSIFYFQPVFFRVLQTAKDLVLSVLYYIFEPSGALSITPTVNEIPPGMTDLLPITLEEFQAGLERTWELLWQREVFAAYLELVGEFLAELIEVLYPLSLLVLCVVMILYAIYDRVEPVDEKTGEPERTDPTKPLKAFWWIELHVIYPIVSEILLYIEYLKKSRYIKPLRLTWLYNLNILTILGEGIAFVFYLGPSLDFVNIFVQALKLLVDLSVALDFLPIWVTGLIVFAVFDAWRRKQGDKKLNKNEGENQKFLEENPENFIATGRPRVGKTQTITDMAQSQEAIFRRKAEDNANERMMNFPHFPWTKLQRVLRRMRKCVPTYDLDFIHAFFGDMKRNLERTRMINVFSAAKRRAVAYEIFASFSFYRKRGYEDNDFIFGYDCKRYGTSFFNGVQEISLFDMLELYAQEFYVYTSPTSLLVSNYPIRSSATWTDYGHYPIIEHNFFGDRKDETARNTLSHIAILDAFRLGKKKDPNNPYQNSFEFGGLVLSELGKELGNQNTNQGKKADSEECNVRNDLFVANAKMQSHGSTVGYQCYFRIMGDEQRSASIQADFRELGSELRIEDRTDPKILMPGYLVEESAFLLSKKMMKKIYHFFAVRKSRECLLFYLLTQSYALLWQHHERVKNKYSSHDAIIRLVDHSSGQLLSEGRQKRYHVSKQKNAGAYNTAFFGTWYAEKRRRSKVGGINQMPTFGGLDPTLSEMRMMGSHFYESLDVMFGGQTAEKKPENARKAS